LLPEGFSAEDHLPDWLQARAPSAALLIHHLRTGAIRTGGQRWLSLPRDDMQRHFGSYRTWADVRDAFKDAGVWRCDNTYVRHAKAHWYRLLPPWNDRPLVRHEIVDRAVVRRLSENEQLRRESEGWGPVHHHLAAFLAKVQIDRVAAEPWLATLDPDSRQDCRDIIASFKVGSHKCVRDEYGRLHTPVTRMMRGLRQFLTYNGRPFGYADVSSCQPFLLGLLCLPGLNAESIKLGGVLERRKEGEKTPLPFFPPVHTCDRQMSEVDPGLHGYMMANSEGRYYQEFAAIQGKPCETKDEIAMVKEASCVLIFGKRGPGRAFTKRWRTVAAKLRDMKESNYLNVAHTLQRLESGMMIEGVCGDLMRDHPRLPLLTIHDGIMAPQESMGLVREAIQRRFGCFGYPVHLK